MFMRFQKALETIRGFFVASDGSEARAVTIGELVNGWKTRLYPSVNGCAEFRRIIVGDNIGWMASTGWAMVPYGICRALCGQLATSHIRQKRADVGHLNMS
jgi:hypothetical protein